MTTTADAVAVTEPTFEELAGRVDAAVTRVEGLAGEAREAGRELRAALEAFHRGALVHIVRTLKADDDGKRLLFELVDEPNVHAVLALHGIIRADPMTRAQRELVSVRPYLQSHGGDVELVRIDGGTAFVRLHGSCNGCSMSSVTLREGVEAALLRLDEVDRIEVLKDEPTAAFIPLTSIGKKPSTGWVATMRVDDVPAGAMRRFDSQLAPASGEDAALVDSFVVINVDQKISVFRNECAHQGRPLDGGLLEDGTLTCPWHGMTFDASSGECLSAPGAQLTPVPTRIDDGFIWIRARGG